MKLFLKIFGIAFCLALLFSVLYLIWGNNFEYFGKEEYYREIRSTAWLVADCLLVADLLLPVPATPIMAVLGTIYGPWFGAMFAFAGSAGAGITGFGLARFFGKRGVRLITSEREMEKFHRFFESWGVYAVIVSRALPIMPEVICILAGLSGMSFARFFVALLAGTIPVAGLLAWSGYISGEHAWYAVVLATVIPALLWPLFFRYVCKNTTLS